MYCFLIIAHILVISSSSSFPFSFSPFLLLLHRWIKKLLYYFFRINFVVVVIVRHFTRAAETCFLHLRLELCSALSFFLCSFFFIILHLFIYIHFISCYYFKEKKKVFCCYCFLPFFGGFALFFFYEFSKRERDFLLRVRVWDE